MKPKFNPFLFIYILLTVIIGGNVFILWMWFDPWFLYGIDDFIWASIATVLASLFLIQQIFKKKRKFQLC